MKAIRFAAPNLVETADVPVPELAAGEALIRVRYSGICGSDVHVMGGHHPTACYPVIPGHEFVGELVAVQGSSRPDLQPGDLVAAQPFYACGVCDACLAGRENVCASLRILGIHQDGSFAEYVRVLASKVYRLPGGMDLRLAALIEPLAVGVHDVRMSGLQIGQSCLIIGGGPIGLIIALVARLSGARLVTIAEVSPFRLAVARQLGFETIDPAAEAPPERTRALTGGKGFDVVFEASGSRAGVAAVTDVARIAGTIVIVGMASASHPFNTTQAFIKELTIQGVRIHSQLNFAAAIDLLASGRLDEPLRSLISAVYPLDRGAEAFAVAARGGDCFKVLVEI